MAPRNEMGARGYWPARCAIHVPSGGSQFKTSYERSGSPQLINSHAVCSCATLPSIVRESHVIAIWKGRLCLSRDEEALTAATADQGWVAIPMMPRKDSKERVSSGRAFFFRNKERN
jgi:hypothetical protein